MNLCDAPVVKVYWHLPISTPYTHQMGIAFMNLSRGSDGPRRNFIHGDMLGSTWCTNTTWTSIMYGAGWHRAILNVNVTEHRVPWWANHYWLDFIAVWNNDIFFESVREWGRAISDLLEIHIIHNDSLLTVCTAYTNIMIITLCVSVNCCDTPRTCGFKT